LVKLNRITQGAHVTVLAKMDGRYPAHWLKCRIVAALIWDAVKRGVFDGSTGLAA